MTNLNAKIAILTATLVLSLVGCKKDEETYASFTVATTSIDFEWGQTKELTFTSNKIVTFNEPIVPNGWSCVLGAGRYHISSPAALGPNISLGGTIQVSVVTDTGTTLTRNIAVNIKVASEIYDIANCIIITGDNYSKRFKFGATRRGTETTETLTTGASASLLWTTDKTAVMNVSLENGHVYFATGSATKIVDDKTVQKLVEGNAVIVLHDADGNVLWSWHIWATETDPRENPDMIGTHRVMNRNLGAFANSTDTEDDVVRSYGLYYQWGRKDPFVGPVAWNSTTPHPMYNNSGRYSTHAFEISSAETGTVEYAISHPGAFIAGAKDNAFDWIFSGHKNDLWSTTGKTIYDPCPIGWRVAPRTIWAGFTTTGNAASNIEEFNVDGEYEHGWNFVNGTGTVFLPAAGRRSFSPSLAKVEDNFTNIVNNDEGVGFPVGFYWSADAPATGALAFRRDYINPSTTHTDTAETAAAGGFPLRCVAE